MRTRIVRFGIAVVVATLLAGPGLLTNSAAAEGQGPPPDGFGQCMSDCVRGLSFLGTNVSGKICQTFCRFTSGNGS